MRYFMFIFSIKSSKSSMYFTFYNAPQFAPATVEVFHNYTRLVATKLDSMGPD